MLIGAGIGIPFQQNVLARLLGSAEFFAPLTHSAIPTRAASGTTGTFTRATTSTWPNNDGYLVTGVAGEIGFVGARRVDNLIRLGAAQSSTLAIAANVTMTLPAGAYQFSMGAGTGTATFSGTGGATGTLAASASGRVFVAKTITAGTLIVTGSAAILNDIQVVSMVAETDQTTIREYVSVGVESAPYYHGSFVDGVKCFPTDLAGNPLPTQYTYDAVSLNGVAGTYVSTPDSVANSITGDIDIRVKAALTDWTPAAVSALVAKDDAVASRCFVFYVNTSGQLEFTFSVDGLVYSRLAMSSAAVGADNGASTYVRMTYAAATGKVNFYTAADGISWALLGTEQTVAAGGIFDGTAVVEVGSYASGVNGLTSGKIYRAQIYNGINGTLAVDFDASRYAGGTTLTGSTGETWTLNGNAVIHPTNSPMLGYQAQGARTNLCLQSNAFDNASWTNTNVTVTANAAVAPDGTTTADLLYPASSGVDGDRRTLQAVTSTTVTHTVSFYLKYAGFRWVMVSNTDAGANSDKNWFDVQNGVVGTIGAGTTSMSSVSVGNGWYRVSVTATNASTNCYAWVSCVDGNGSSTVTASGTNGVYAWGAQVELGSFASSYIATTTTAVTGNVDVESVSTSGNIAAAAGSIYLEYTPTHTPSGTIALWGTYVDASNYTAILHDATNLIFRKRIAGVNYDATIANAFVAGTTYKACATWGAAGTSITLNGTEGTPHANTTAAQIAATMQWGADGNSLQQPFASIRNCRDWLRQLSASERAAVTA